MDYALRASESLARGQPVAEWLPTLLEELLRSFKLADNAVASVYRFIYRANTLVCEARAGRGNLSVAPDIVELSPPVRAGIAGWVAIKRRGILVENIAKSAFSRLITTPSDGLTKILSVPLLVGPRVMGVLKIDAAPGSTLGAPQVRSIWYAAHQSALAYNLHDQASFNQKLLSIGQRLTFQRRPFASASAFTKATLRELATLMCESLNAADCDIWQWNAERREFNYTGATYDNFPDDPPRSKGWTNYIQKTQTPVVLSKIVAVDRFNAQFWHPDDRCWKDVPPPTKYEPPRTVNELAVTNRYAEVGIPFVLDGTCLGVGWLKFRSSNWQRPSPSALEHMTGFAAQAAHVIDHAERYHDSIALQSTLRALSQSLLSPAPGTTLTRSCFECHVEQRALDKRSNFGGDFHAVVDLPNKCHTGIILGDGQGHGLPGALHMLAIISAFKTVCLDSSSTKHILLGLQPICNQLQVRGTAVYFIIEQFTADDPQQKKMLRMFVSSVGHPPLILVKPTGLPKTYPADAARGLPLGFGTTGDLSEDVVPLEAGDMLVGVTDGVLDALDDSPAMAIQLLTSFAIQAPRTSAAAMARYICDRAIEKRAPSDDITVMVLLILPTAPGPVDFQI
jgi:hypothetical protein